MKKKSAPVVKSGFVAIAPIKRGQIVAGWKDLGIGQARPARPEDTKRPTVYLATALEAIAEGELVEFVYDGGGGTLARRGAPGNAGQRNSSRSRKA